MQLKNDLILRTIRGEKTERTPIWLMRQAGRILPEYRAVREKMNGFVELVKDPERAAEVTIQPVDILGVDAAIIFSDILVIPEAMGLPYEMVEKRGPYFPRTVNSAKDIERLKVADISGDLAYTPEAIKVTKRELNGRVPIIGFAGAPWTIFAYMVEGSGSKTFSKPRAMLYKEPELAHRLLQMITDSTIAYLKAQIAAGVSVVQVFDSWAGILSTQQYADFSLYYISRICEAITEVPVTVFAKGALNSMPAMRDLACETIGMDWNMEIPYARELYGEQKVLQGNLDPAVLYADEQVIEREAKRMLDAYGPYRHIANLGHGVYPDIDPNKVKHFIEVVKEYSSQMRP